MRIGLSEIPNRIDRRCAATTAVLSLAFSSLIVLGSQLDQSGRLHDGGLVVGQIMLLLFLIWPLCYFTFLLIKRAESRSHAAKTNDKQLSVCVTACVIALGIAMMLWFFVLAPGIYGYDSAIQYIELATEGYPVIDQWSIAYGWVFVTLTKIGSSITGSTEGGFALCMLLQATFICYVEIRIITLIASRYRLRWPVIAATIFLAVSPPLALMAFSSTHDTVFMGCFALIAINLVEMIDDPRCFWSHLRKPIALASVMLVFLLMRNNGFYILMLTLPFCAFAAKGYRIKLLLLMIVPLVLFQIYRGPILDSMGVYKGMYIGEALQVSDYQGSAKTMSSTSSKAAQGGLPTGMNAREMLSVPLQQIARTYIEHADTLSEEQLEQLQVYFPEKDSVSPLESYETFPCISDEVKGSLNALAVQADLVHFMQLYVSLGIQHPRSYLEAALLSNIGLWYPFKQYPDSRMYHPYIESECSNTPHHDDETYIVVESASMIPQVDEYVQHLYGIGQEHFSTHPILALVSKSGTYFFLILFVIAFSVYRKKWACLLALAPFAFLELSVLLGPVILFRYIAPVVIAAPLLASLLFAHPAKRSGFKE